MMDQWEMMDVYKALMAIGAGIILGLERELKDKAAGLKTITVICLGSALFSILSYKIGSADHESTRIASYIVSGIGFLGAGVIFKERVDVTGLTTAGIIWLTAAVGMAIGFGQFFLAATFVFAAMIIVYSSKWINKLIRPTRQSRDLVLEISKENLDRKDEIMRELKHQGIQLLEKRIELLNDRIIVIADTTFRTSKLKWLEHFLINNEYIIAFSL
jgi:putative Mg2+ transporter-C (MgtC) family protein